MWRLRVRDLRAARSTSRELLCSYFDWIESRNRGSADRPWRSASADSGAALSRDHRMDHSEQYFGAVAEVPRVHRCLLCDRKRDRDLGLNCVVCSDGAGSAVRGFAVISCGEPRTPLHRVAAEVETFQEYLRDEFYTPTVCALGFAASNWRSTYCKMPPSA